MADQGFIVYLIENTVNGKVYVGQTTCGLKRRASAHRIEARRYAAGKSTRTSSHLYPAMNKYGTANFKFSVLCFATSKEELDDLEKLWIKKLQSTNPSIGYNLDNGGTGKGKMSDATRKKQSIVQTGKKLSEETKRLISLGNKGRIASVETRKRLSEANKGSKNHLYGKHLDEKYKSKVSEGMKKYWATQIELKQKMSENMSGEKNHFFGKKHTQEVLDKCSKASKGRTPTDETREKLRISSTGRVFSPERCKRISEAKKAYWAAKKTKEKLEDKTGIEPASSPSGDALSS